MVDKQAIEAGRHRTEEWYRSGQLNCSEAVFLVGMGMAGCACGALTGCIMALGLKYGRSQAGAEKPGMFEAAKELHDRFVKRRGHACCRILVRGIRPDSLELIEHCSAIIGEVAADVIELLARDGERIQKKEKA